MGKILEVCVDSLASARTAIAGGADRLELCSALTVGGLTPYCELLRQIRAESDIPIRCLIRCRAGDFLYSKEEIVLMAEQIRNLKREGATGFVIGCLTAEGNLDADAMNPLIAAAEGAPLTLHRCIDVSRDLCKTWQDAKSLGFDTVLTSGGASDCEKGMDTIGELLRLRDSEDGPEILIGAGVNARRILAFRNLFPGACAFHASAKTLVESKMSFRRDDVPMGLPGLDEWHIQQTDTESVRQCKDALCK